MSGGGPMFTGDYSSKLPESEGWYPLTKRVISNDAYRGDGGGMKPNVRPLSPEIRRDGYMGGSSVSVLPFMIQNVYPIRCNNTCTKNEVAECCSGLFQGVLQWSVQHLYHTKSIGGTHGGRFC